MHENIYMEPYNRPAIALPSTGHEPPRYFNHPQAATRHSKKSKKADHHYDYLTAPHRNHPHSGSSWHPGYPGYPPAAGYGPSWQPQPQQPQGYNNSNAQHIIINQPGPVQSERVIQQEAMPSGTGAMCYACFVCWCCCPALGFIAFIIAAMAGSSSTVASARKKVRVSTIISHVGLALGIVAVVLNVVLYFV